MALVRMVVRKEGRKEGRWGRILSVLETLWRVLEGEYNAGNTAGED